MAYLTACDELKKTKEQLQLETGAAASATPASPSCTRNANRIGTSKLDLLRREVDKTYFIYLGHKNALQQLMDKRRQLDDPLSVRLLEQKAASEELWKWDMLNSPTLEAPDRLFCEAKPAQAELLKKRSVELFDLSRPINFTADDFCRDVGFHDLPND